MKIYIKVEIKFIGRKDEEIFDGVGNDECRRYCNLVINTLKPLTEEVI